MPASHFDVKAMTGRPKFIVRLVQSVYKRTYIKSPVELCGSIFFLAELCQAVEGGKLDVK
jgi:hypothetical protein